MINSHWDWLVVSLSMDVWLGRLDSQNEPEGLEP